MIKLTRPVCPNPKALADGDYRYSQNKAALKKASHDKCMYCESKITHIDYGDVEHIKPKSTYPNSKLDWDNLGYACVKCNRDNKKSSYDENTPIINPYEEDPSDFILFAGPMIFSKKGSERGKITILDAGLDRPELFEKRLEKINQIDKAIGQCNGLSNDRLKLDALEELKKEANEDKEYSLCVMYFLRQHEIF